MIAASFGKRLGFTRFKRVWGRPRDGVPSISQAQSFYERHSELTWWFVMARIGQDLRERYQVPEELPSKLLVLVNRGVLRRLTPPRAL
jgi:hypothetical protein